MVSVVTPPEIVRTTFALAEYVNRHPVMILLETAMKPIRIAVDRNVKRVSRDRDVDRTQIAGIKFAAPMGDVPHQPATMV